MGFGRLIGSGPLVLKQSPPLSAQRSLSGASTLYGLSFRGRDPPAGVDSWAKLRAQFIARPMNDVH